MVTTLSKYTLVGCHKRWVSGCEIREYVNEENMRRFTATISGWRGWLIYEGPTPAPAEAIIAKVREILELIESGNEAIFNRSGKPFLSIV